MYQSVKKFIQVSVLILFIGIIFQCNTTIAQAGSTTGCQPVTIEICTICGNDYHSGNCPHVKNNVYNQEVCDPYDGAICTICDGAFSSCSHAFGESYGGEVCSVYDQCNICGNDYYNGDVCQHKRGQSYGGEVCTTYYIQICNACGNDYNDPNVCPHLEENGDCSPEDLRFCSICGNHYDNPNICPHVEGHVYGGDICTPIKICSICGNNYEDGNVCPHLEGEHYGGTTCSYYVGRICNVCGNNYSDGNQCPHLEGHSYNGETCTTSATTYCNICSNNYYSSDCLHVNGREYKNVVYYFYISQWRNAALHEQRTLMNYFGLRQEQVVLVEVSNYPTFNAAWNNIGYLNGELANTLAVVVDSHANDLILQANPWNLADPYSISRLPEKKVGQLILFGCNAGHLDNRYNNPAANFAKKVHGAPVLASDGTVISSYHDVFLLSQVIVYDSVNNTVFQELCTNGLRDNVGFLIYQCKNGTINISKSIRKSMTLTSMLDYIG